MKNTTFVTGEFYHIYNRGVDKRNVFSDATDLDRFLKSTVEFNVVEPVGSLFELSFVKENKKKPNKRLVDMVCYCLNPNHYHFVLRQKIDGGISEYMKRLGGYTKYFNIRYKRSGALFQSVFQSSYIDSNNYLLRASAYVNLNNRVHQLGRETSKCRSSWAEYMGSVPAELCEKNIILKQFKNVREYKIFAEEALDDILENKQRSKELANLLLE